MNATGHRFAEGKCVGCGLGIDSNIVAEKCLAAWIVAPGAIFTEHSELLGRCIGIPTGYRVGLWASHCSVRYNPAHAHRSISLPPKPKRSRNWPDLTPVRILLGFIAACIVLHAVGLL